MRLPIVYANTAVRVLEIIGANVASLIVIITSNVVIELDLTSLPRCNGSKGAKKKEASRREDSRDFPRYFLKYLSRLVITRD